MRTKIISPCESSGCCCQTVPSESDFLPIDLGITSGIEKTLNFENSGYSVSRDQSGYCPECDASGDWESVDNNDYEWWPTNFMGKARLLSGIVLEFPCVGINGAYSSVSPLVTSNSDSFKEWACTSDLSGCECRYGRRFNGPKPPYTTPNFPSGTKLCSDSQCNIEGLYNDAYDWAIKVISAPEPDSGSTEAVCGADLRGVWHTCNQKYNSTYGYCGSRQHGCAAIASAFASIRPSEPGSISLNVESIDYERYRHWIPRTRTTPGHYEYDPQWYYQVRLQAGIDDEVTSSYTISSSSDDWSGSVGVNVPGGKIGFVSLQVAIPTGL